MSKSTSTPVAPAVESVFAFTPATTPESATEAYRAASVSDKAAMRANVTEAIRTSVMSGDIEAAQHLMGIQSTMSTPAKVASTVDYGKRVADLHATLLDAVARIEAGQFILPEGVTLDTEPDLGAGVVDEKASAKLRTVTGRKSGRGSVEAYVEAHLGDEPMTVADLRRAFTSTEAYPTQPPSAGAIAAFADRLGDESPYAVTEVNGTKALVRA